MKKVGRENVLYAPDHASCECRLIGRHLSLFGHHVRPVSANESYPSHGTYRERQSQMEFFFFNKNGKDLKGQAGAWAWTECHRRPIFFLEKSKNVTDVLLVFRHRLCPTTAVLRGVTFEQLAWVGLCVSGLEALFAGLACGL